MRWTQLLIPTLREDPQDAEIISHKLLVRGGFIRKLTAGAYSYLPLGYKVLSKVQNIIRDEMVRHGAYELLLPALQPIDLWQRTGRDKTLEDVMIKFRDRHGKITCLGPTHEEVITSLVGGNVSSYRDLPKILFQIQTKFRDEIRPRFGILRSCEFIMKDAYSFDTDKKGLEKSYKKMYDAYCAIFERCGLPYLAVDADSGAMGGGESHEFMIPTEIGEDLVGICGSCGYSASKDILLKCHPPQISSKSNAGDLSVKVSEGQSDGVSEMKGPIPCPKCQKELELKQTIEVGHTFKLGYKYSTPLNAQYLSKEGEMKDIVMGCYGIGVNRILAASVEVSNDKDGMIWPAAISPFEVAVLPLNMKDPGLQNKAFEIYDVLSKSGIDVIIDDREERPGVKFKDADLIGFPVQVILGQKSLKKGLVEIKIRKTGETKKVELKEIIDEVAQLIASL